MKHKIKGLVCFVLIFSIICMMFTVGEGLWGSLEFSIEAKGDEIYEDIAQFPKSYQTALYALKQAHPNWVFQMFDTGLEWDTVMYNQTNPPSRSLLPSYFGSSMVGDVYGDGWSYATYEAVEYYLDPRNWLTEDYIFQFELLTFNDSYQSVVTVQKVLQNTFMKGFLEDQEGVTYAQTFYDIGKELGVSPVHLACRVYQEQGVSGKSELISGTYPGYEGYYNYFNIQASGATREEIVRNGLNEAVSEGWTSRYLALRGGSTKVSQNYILKGQDTLYLQKFDVDNTYYGMYWHQYMQNLAAPSNEGKKVKKAYESNGSLENSFVFKIPVYRNMPDPDKAAHIVDDGRYYIESLDGSYVLAVGEVNPVEPTETLEASVETTESTETEGIVEPAETTALSEIADDSIIFTDIEYCRNNQWVLSQVDENYYVITSAMDGSYIMLEQDSLERGIRLVAAPLDGSNIPDRAKWYIKESDDGGYYICSKHNGMYISFSKEAGGEGAFTYTKNDAYVQKFMLEAVTQITVASQYQMVHDDNQIIIGLTTETEPEKGSLEYYWEIRGTDNNEIVYATPWIKDNEWLIWEPTAFKEFKVFGCARPANDLESVVYTESTFIHHPKIIGICQMPYLGEGGGYLIGVETVDNPEQSYQYQMLILDCTLLAEGKDAWVYDTGKFTVSEGNAGWTIWQPQYGYYWTLFRVYDKDGKMIDEQCYGFENIY